MQKKTTNIYSSKADQYAKYRWQYAPECLDTIVEKTGVGKDAIVADIGAGTGILTKEFVGKVKQIYAVEPNLEMRVILAKEQGQYSTCEVIDGSAEATTLVDNSIDLVTVAQSIHWFDPIPAKREIYRILKPGGWLAICRNYGTDQELGQALAEVYPPEKDTEGLMIGKSKPVSFYYCGDHYIKREFPFRTRVKWDEFLGALGTASYAPDEGGAFYAEFEYKAKQVFDRFSSNNLIDQNGITELYLGQI